MKLNDNENINKEYVLLESLIYSTISTANMIKIITKDITDKLKENEDALIVIKTGLELQNIVKALDAIYNYIIGKGR